MSPAAAAAVDEDNGTPDGCDELLLAVQLVGAAADAWALSRVLFRASAIAMACEDPRSEFLRIAKLAGGDAETAGMSEQ